MTQSRLALVRLAGRLRRVFWRETMKWSSSLRIRIIPCLRGVEGSGPTASDVEVSRSCGFRCGLAATVLERATVRN
jgi:hypothetical protein